MNKKVTSHPSSVFRTPTVRKWSWISFFSCCWISVFPALYFELHLCRKLRYAAFLFNFEKTKKWYRRSGPGRREKKKDDIQSNEEMILQCKAMLGNYGMQKQYRWTIFFEKKTFDYLVRLTLYQAKVNAVNRQQWFFYCYCHIAKR